MYLRGTIAIDPSQITELKRQKPTKGFAKIASFLTAGLTSPMEERETFTAVTILQQVFSVLSSLGMNNLVRLSKDDVIFYDDREGRDDDLKEALDQFFGQTQDSESKLFETLELVLEHATDGLSLLIAIRIKRVHAVGELPIEIVVNGVSDELNAAAGEEQVQAKLDGVFSSQSQYDAATDTMKGAFEAVVERLAAAFEKHMQVDKIARNVSANIVRPNGRIGSKGELPDRRSGYGRSGYYNDPIYNDYHGNNDLFFYCFLWSAMCNDNDIHCHDCNVVDDTGAELLMIDEAGIDAGEVATLNPDEPLPVVIDDGSPVSAEVVGDADPSTFDCLDTASDSASTDAGGGGWLSSIADSISDSFDSDSGSSCGGSSCSSCSSCGGD